ncbi:MAG: DNA-binding protein WhiA [Clostridia bacterium]|nr:DNA-binding protein WhiA [Clostridia bacterium]
MSFSKTVKDEIIKKNIHKAQTKAIVQGLFLSSGSLIISGGRLSFLVSNESESVILYLKQKLIELYGDIEIDIVQIVKSFKNKERYELSVQEDYNDKILRDLGIIQETADGETFFSDVCDKSFVKSQETMQAFLTGVYLGSGSLSVPTETSEKRKYGYHMEIVMTSKEQVDLIAEILSNFDIFPKIVERNELFVLYLKNSELICDTLQLLGANKTLLELMSQKVSRDVNNNANRQVNCISANIDKAVNAALKQMQAIEIIQNTIGIENLPETLAEAALARIANPEGSLKELLFALDNKISKGALAQRFDKIIKLSEELGENDDK